MGASSKMMFAALPPSSRVNFFFVPATASAQDPLPSWNDGPAKQAIVDFVRTTTETGGAKFVPPEERVAAFDQDGTLWVEHPVYSQLIYCLDRVPVLAKEKPELKNVEPFKTVLSGDLEAIAKLPRTAQTKVGTFTQALYDEAKKNGWFVISMKNDWKVIFPFELGK